MREFTNLEQLKPDRGNSEELRNAMIEAARRDRESTSENVVPPPNMIDIHRERRA